MSQKMHPITNDEEKRDKILSMAMGEALKYGFAGFAVVGAATLAGAMKSSKRFNEITSISAKTSFPIMAGIGLFSYRYEIVMYDAKLNPENWGLGDGGQRKLSRMPWHHKLINSMHDQPFKLVAALGVPFTGLVLYKNMQLSHLTFSQKIMHSRVLAQGGVIAILLATMLFKEIMDKRGRFPDPDDEL